MHSTASLILVAALATSGAAEVATPSARPLAPWEREALRSLDDPALAGLSAGSAPLAPVLDDTARDELRRLQSESRALEAQRAGDLDLDNETLETVLLVLGIVVLVAIIL